MNTVFPEGKSKPKQMSQTKTNISSYAVASVAGCVVVGAFVPEQLYRYYGYLHFLCYYEYENKVIRSVSGVDFTCPNNSTADLISNVNYPSISIAHLDSNRKTVVSVPRTVINVGPANSTYTATVEAPKGFTVTVWPNKLYFGRRGGKASYEVKFEVGDGVKNGYGYGSVTWSDGAHLVRTVFAVNVV